MNILFLTIAWPSPGNKNIYSDLMEEFVTMGHNVYVIGTHNSAKFSKSDIRKENGMQVLRIHTQPIRKAPYFRKAISLLTLGSKFLKAINKSLQNVNFDLIIGPTPPITLSILYKKLKKKYSVPFYLLLKDIWPQGSVDLNVFRKYSIPWFFFRIHEIRIYKTADYIGCMSPLGVNYLLSKNKFIQNNKVEVCPNSIRPVMEGTKKVTSNKIRTKYNIPKDACIFLFSGNLGKGHGLDFLVDAIKYLSDYPNAFFTIGGSGTHFRFLQDKLRNHKNNVLLYEWLPREDYMQILHTIDVGLILLHKYSYPQFPSRLLSYLEYSKPILCAANKYTDIGSIVEDSNIGRSVEHGDMQAFIKEIKFFSENPSERKIMGENGYRLLLEKYTASHSYNIIMRHFEKPN